MSGSRIRNTQFAVRYFTFYEISNGVTNAWQCASEMDASIEYAPLLVARFVHTKKHINFDYKYN